MKNTVSCRVCESRNCQNFIKVDNWTISECLDCRLKFLHPLPSKEDIDKLYKKPYFNDGIGETGGYKNYSDMKCVLQNEASRRIKHIKKFNIGKSWLDIGAGTGDFLTVAQKQGFQISGNDISPYAVKAMRNKKIKVYPGALENNVLPRQKFDVITAWDVVEHLSNPNTGLSAIKAALKPGGYFFFTSPDTNSWDAKLMGKSWYGYKKIPEHLLYFNQKSTKLWLDKSGMELLEFKQWGFERELKFIIQKFPGPWQKTVSSLLEKNNLSQKTIFLPIIDFLVVARKRVPKS